MRMVVCALGLCIGSGAAVGFDIDISPQEAARLFGGRYVSDLAVGDRAAIESRGLCVDGSRLFVMSETAILSYRSEYGPVFWVTREANASVTLVITPSEKSVAVLGVSTPRDDEWGQLIGAIRSSCNIRGQALGDWMMYPVTTVNGYSSLSELVRAVKAKDTE